MAVANKLNQGLLSLTKMVVVFICTVLAACAEHTSYGEFYKPTYSSAKEGKPFNIDAYIRGSSDIEDNATMWRYLFFDSHQQIGAPYRLIVVSRYYGIPDKDVSLVSVLLRLNKSQQVLVIKPEEETFISYEPWLEHAVSGNIEVGLNGILGFHEGNEITIIVDYINPITGKREQFEKSFVGRIEERSFGAIDILNSV